MSLKKVLVVNAAGYIGGDVRMFLLGLPFLDPQHYFLRVVTPPCGDTYAHLRNISNAHITLMDLGSKELSCEKRSHNFDRIDRVIKVVKSTFHIASLVRSERIDVIYSLDRTVSSKISYLVSRITGCPLVLSAHNWNYLQISPLMREIVRHAARVTVPSKAAQAHFLPYVRNPDRLATIPNAIAIDQYDPTLSGAAVREEFGIPQQSPVIVLAGRLNPWKGQEELIRAAAIIRYQRPDIRFLLAGNEDVAGYKATLERLISEYQVGDQVRLIGYRNDLTHILAAADLCVLPSHGETFGLTVAEAMALERPVVATRVGGIPEFVIDGETGILIEPRDYQALAAKILQSINDPDRAKAMGRRGRSHISAYFNERLYGVRIVAVLDDVINVRKGKKSLNTPLSRLL